MSDYNKGQLWTLVISALLASFIKGAVFALGGYMVLSWLNVL